MLIQLFAQGQAALAIIILIAIVISLTFHEYGHAVTAKLFGDDTAQRAGRLTLNPMAHIDPFGLLMVAMVGFGYAKPVPTNPRNFKSLWADLFVSAAGPAMNFLVGFVAINLYFFGVGMGWDIFQGPGPQYFFIYLAVINMVLMLFNLLPIGALDGHYILPYFLPKRLAYQYRQWNDRYGNYLLLGLILLSLIGVPIFSRVFQFGQIILPYITFTA